MCVILAKEKDKRLPDKIELENCFNRNNDGAGFMYVKNNRVVIDKGYMTFKSFYKHYKKLCRKYNNFENKSLVIHFRIGTSGTNTPKNTHPYPVTSDITSLHKNYITCDLGIAHNGIIYDYSPSYLEKATDTNDTQEFIAKYLTPLKENYKEFYKNNYILKGIKSITSSKFALLDNQENIYYIGDFINNNGIYYSNESYKKIEYTYNNYKSCNFSYDKYKYDSTDPYKEEKKEEKEVGYLYQNIIEVKKGYWIEYGEEYEQIKEDGLYYYDLDTFELLDYNLKTIRKNVVLFNQDYEEIYL